MGEERIDASVLVAVVRAAVRERLVVGAGGEGLSKAIRSTCKPAPALRSGMIDATVVG